MAKCNCCGNSKLFLTLTNGLCNNCKETLNSYEYKYKRLLASSQEPNPNINLLTSDLIGLSIDLRKFDDFSNSIKSSDCDLLLDVIKSKEISSSNELINNNPIKENILDDKKLPQSEISLPPVEQASIEEKSKTFSNTLNSTTLTDIISNESVPIPKANSYNNLSDDHVIDIKDHIISDFNVNEPMTDEDSVIDNFTHTLPLNQTESFDTSTLATPKEERVIEKTSPTLSNSDLADIKNLIDFLTMDTLPINEKCYYAYSLRDTYLTKFDKTNLNEIFNIDLEKLIEITLNKVALALNCPLNELYSYYNYVAFSIQTTGIRIESNSIIEISAVKVRFGQVVDTFKTLVNPLTTISRSVETSTKIYNSDLINAPTLDEVFEDFLNFCDGLTLVTHNANFNYKFLDYHYMKLFNKSLSFNVCCTIKLYRKRYKQFYGEPTKDGSLYACCNDLLTKNDLKFINAEDSISYSSALGTFKLYEIIKWKYK